MEGAAEWALTGAAPSTTPPTNNSGASALREIREQKDIAIYYKQMTVMLRSCDAYHESISRRQLFTTLAPPTIFYDMR